MCHGFVSGDLRLIMIRKDELATCIVLYSKTVAWARSRMPMKDKDCEERNEPPTLTERGLAAIQSPRKPNGLSHCTFECLIVEASSQAQNHLSVLADRYTERCRGVFDCTRDG